MDNIKFMNEPVWRWVVFSIFMLTVIGGWVAILDRMK